MQKLFTRKIVSAVCAVIGFMGIEMSSAEAQWGTLSGQVILDDNLPNIPSLVVKGNATVKDAAVCAAQEVPDEKLVVNPTTKGIANVVIYLAKKPAKVHPDLANSKHKEVVFDQKNCRFIPHVMLVRTDQQVRVKSDDGVAHNTHTKPIKNNSENFILSANDRTGVLMKPITVVERAPVKISCDIHSWMAAYWVILDHSYAAVTDEQGNFEISNLPVGNHDFMIWHESAGWLDKKYAVTIKDGSNEPKTINFKTSQILK